MCGLCGWLSPSPEGGPRAAPLLAAMLDSLVHRGPDGQGEHLGAHVALGHRRLAVIDLAGGAQPMSSADGQVTLVYNGEIYNFAALRDDLRAQGQAFRTRSDTEVILALYQNGGWQAWRRLRGMFAFVLWDGAQRRAYLVRDACGIKPLFFHHRPDGTLVFASEAKAILAVLPELARIDEQALHVLMNFRYLPGGLSLFRGIEQLSPGAVLEWRPDSGARARQRTLAPDVMPAEDVPMVLRQSVQAHAVADVEVGAYLSGGLDSAALVSILKRQCGIRPQTFTLAVGDDPREAPYAAESARLLGVPNKQAPLILSLEDDLPRLLWHLETPKVNAVQVYALARFAARDVKVVLSGLGGDELFYGYNAHRIFYQLMRLPGALARMAGRSAAPLLARLGSLPWGEPERALRMLGHHGDWPWVYGLLRNVWDSPRLRRDLYGPRMLDASPDGAFDVLREAWPCHRDPLVAMNQFEWRNKLVNDLLWQEDRAAMAWGLEVRVPFVDADLHAAVQHLGRRTLMPGGQLKGYMKNSLRHELPGALFARPKSGFQLHAPRFFNQHLRPLAREYLSERRLTETGLFNPEFVRQVLRRPPRTGLRWHYFILYLMLMTELCVDIFEKHRRPAGHAP
ncbi:MAG TPA: asparagine synthase (glutamine-hydrolyzing) [Gammaproteobacteria bacterium]|nr:asparagine synthase (glutamine-hydrolyzing) [Gammaproteobacteria bacterium]